MGGKGERGGPGARVSIVNLVLRLCTDYAFCVQFVIVRKVIDYNRNNNKKQNSLKLAKDFYLC